jgi:hypothetical protein
MEGFLCSKTERAAPLKVAALSDHNVVSGRGERPTPPAA